MEKILSNFLNMQFPRYYNTHLGLNYSIFLSKLYNPYMPKSYTLICTSACSHFRCRIWPWHTRVLLGCTVTFLESLICSQLLNCLVPDLCLQSSVLYWIIYQVRWVVRSILHCHAPRTATCLETVNYFKELTIFLPFSDYRYGAENNCTARSFAKIDWTSFIWWWYNRLH